MKNIYKITLLIGFLSLTGCEEQLTTDPIGLSVKEDSDKKPTITAVENSVSSSYQLFSNTMNLFSEEDWNWSTGLVFQSDLIVQDIASDDMEKKWLPDGDQSWMDEVNNFTFTAANGGPNGAWKYNYEGIKRTNIALGFLLNPDLEKITKMSTERKNQLLGEAYFLRSYYYFSLVNNFGDVPLILSPIEKYQDAFKIIRAPKGEVWNQINADLVRAKDLLPDSKYSSSTEKWRVSKGAVIALQAKSALYNKNWGLVISLVSELEMRNYYDLNANYFDSFNSEYTDNEVIFSYNHIQNVIPKKGNGICAIAGWGFFAPTADFLASFEPNDPRKLYTVNVQEQWVNKLLGSINGTNKSNKESPNNKIYIRYADVLLWKAEALNETGDYAGSIAIINKIRKRARTTVTTTGTIAPDGTLPDREQSTDKAVVKAWLIAERRAELGFESQRMHDLKRWGIAKEVMRAHGKNFQDKHMLYPVPQSEIDATARRLTQNRVINIKPDRF
ncbi:RagB/SusD family nutrient uptake outer membrane protein [Flavobacterium sp. N1736]|uniref:RagB/SusD family nutrient uptake outer membrane protein n=1 Tax=Flavobacterium sp. N1736 TaxID=2986823 RepID=UPI002225772B|nr:RagB/SusD family nutrient uptake outer membrane protein [Flavobacterium sp. N1736]